MKTKQLISKVRLIIIKGDYVLFLKKQNNTFSLPGGVVKPKETNRTALKREVKEEIGVNIDKNEAFYLDYRLKAKNKSLIYKTYYLLNKNSLEPKNMEPHKFKNVKWVLWYSVLEQLDPEDKSMVLQHFSTKLTTVN